MNTYIATFLIMLANWAWRNTSLACLYQNFPFEIIYSLCFSILLILIYRFIWKLLSACRGPIQVFKKQPCQNFISEIQVQAVNAANPQLLHKYFFLFLQTAQFKNQFTELVHIPTKMWVLGGLEVGKREGKREG